MKFLGYVNPNLWNKDKRVFEIKTLGEKSNGAILAGLSVSGKDKDGKTVYGDSISIKVIIKDENEGGRIYKLIADKDTPMVEFEGFFAPNNFTTKDGKEIRGHQIVVTDSTSFKVYEKPEDDKPPFDETPKKEVKPTDEW